MSSDFVAARWGVGWGEETANILRYGQTGRKYIWREEKRCCSSFLHPSSNLSCNKSGCYRCEKFLQKVESSSTFCNKMFTRCAFYPSKANLFCNKWRKSRPGVIPAYFYPIRSEYSRNLHYPDLFMQDRFERGWQNTQYRFLTSFAVILQNKLHIFVAWFKVA